MTQKGLGGPKKAPTRRSSTNHSKWQVGVSKGAALRSQQRDKDKQTSYQQCRTVFGTPQHVLSVLPGCSQPLR